MPGNHQRNFCLYLQYKYLYIYYTVHILYSIYYIYTVPIFHITSYTNVSKDIKHPYITNFLTHISFAHISKQFNFCVEHIKQLVSFSLQGIMSLTNFLSFLI